VALVRSIFGVEIDCAPVRVKRSRWFPFQPVDTVMAPCGHLHFHPSSALYRDDFSTEALGLQGLFLHEMTHVWQAQRKGRWYLPLMRHPFCRYAYSVVPGQTFEQYGIEQQAEIVRHAFLLKRGIEVSAKPGPAVYEDILPFGRA